MKRMLLSIAIVMGAVTFANAQTEGNFSGLTANDYVMYADTTETPAPAPTDTVSKPVEETEFSAYLMLNDTIVDSTKVPTEKAPVELMFSGDEYKEIGTQELNEKIQATIAANYEGYTIAKAFYNEEKSLTKVILVSTADESEKTVILNEEGTVIE